MANVYSPGFVDKVRKLYPNDSGLLEHLNRNSSMVGRYLDDSSNGGLSVETILNARSLDELQEKARILKAKKDLYNEWYNETRDWR